ncbi:MAG: hypothetical protein V7700_12925 [Halioglobus sp.]
MAQTQTQSIPREKFLLMSVNLLHKAFIDATRTTAKNVYKDISDGKAIHLTTVEMEDRSTVRFNLSLDQSEFQGKLNYGAFRASLATLIGNITQALRDKTQYPVFNAEGDDGTLIFGITAVTVEQERPNVMVLAAELNGPVGATMLRLMYLDPQQFAAQQDEVAPGETGA